MSDHDQGPPGPAGNGSGEPGGPDRAGGEGGWVDREAAADSATSPPATGPAAAEEQPAAWTGSLGVGLPYGRRRTAEQRSATAPGTARDAGGTTGGGPAGSDPGSPGWSGAASWTEPPASPPARRRSLGAPSVPGRADDIDTSDTATPGGTPTGPATEARHGRADEDALPDAAADAPVTTPGPGGTAAQGRHEATHNLRAETPFSDEDDLFGNLEPPPPPRRGPRALVYRVTRLNLGPGKKDREERDIRSRLNRQLRRTRGYCGYIGIASEKGGVGKTTLAALLATEVSEGRRESVGVADLNPDLGTLPDRYGIRPHHSIRDLLAHVDEIPWRYHVHDFMDKVPEMNVRVLAASTDRKIRHQLTIQEVELLAELFAPFFSFAILDNGTHITHAAMLGTLKVAHGLVLVTDNTRDGANLARKTLEFLTDNGYPDMRRRVVLAVVAKEVASPVKTRAIDKAFRDHVRELVIVPYDPALDGGGKIPFHDPNAVNKMLRPQTRAAVRKLAAIVIDDLVS